MADSPKNPGPALMFFRRRVSDGCYEHPIDCPRQRQMPLMVTYLPRQEVGPCGVLHQLFADDEGDGPVK